MPEGKAPWFLIADGEEDCMERMPPRIFEGDGSAWDTTCSKTIREHTENYLIFHIVFVLSEFISQYRTITGHCFWRAFHNQTLDPEEDEKMERKDAEVSEKEKPQGVYIPPRAKTRPRVIPAAKAKAALAKDGRISFHLPTTSKAKPASRVIFQNQEVFIPAQFLQRR